MDRYPSSHDSHENSSSDDADAKRAEILDKLAKKNSREGGLFSKESHEDDDDDDEEKDSDKKEEKDDKKDDKKSKKLGSFFGALTGDKSESEDKKEFSLGAIFKTEEKPIDDVEQSDEDIQESNPEATIVEEETAESSVVPDNDIEEAEDIFDYEAVPEETDYKAETVIEDTTPTKTIVPTPAERPPEIKPEAVAPETEIFTESVEHVEVDEDISPASEFDGSGGGEEPPEEPPEVPPEEPEPEIELSTSEVPPPESGYAETAAPSSTSEKIVETERVIERRGVGPVDLLEWYAIHRVHNKVKKQAKEIEDLRRSAGVEEKVLSEVKQEMLDSKTQTNERLVRLETKSDNSAKTSRPEIRPQVVTAEDVKTIILEEANKQEVNENLERKASEAEQISLSNNEQTIERVGNAEVYQNKNHGSEYSTPEKSAVASNERKPELLQEDTIEAIELDRTGLKYEERESAQIDEQELLKYGQINENFREKDYDLKREIKDSSASSIGSILSSEGSSYQSMQPTSSALNDLSVADDQSMEHSSVLEATKWMLNEESDRIRKTKQQKQAILSGTITAVVIMALYLLFKLLA
jgi:hypothetical protein